MNKDKEKPEHVIFNPAGELNEKGPVFKGNDLSQPDIECQGCGYLIAQGIKYEQIRNMFTNCPKCGTLYQHT